MHFAFLGLVRAQRWLSRQAELVLNLRTYVLGLLERSPFSCAFLSPLALTSPVQDPNICSGGSAVVCRDVKTAVDCRAVKHCQQMVWSKPTAVSASSMLPVAASQGPQSSLSCSPWTQDLPPTVLSLLFPPHRHLVSRGLTLPPLWALRVSSSLSFPG